MGKKALPAEPLTWLGDKWQHTSWLHPSYVAAGTFALGEACHLANVSPWYAVAGGFATALAGFFSTAGYRFSDAARGYVTGAGLAIGSWLTWASATSPFNQASVVSLVGGAALFSITYPAMRHAQLNHEASTRAWQNRGKDDGAAVVYDPMPDRSEDALRWETFLDHVGLRGLRYLGREANRAGFSVRFRLPINGSVTFKNCVAATERIEIGFPHGREGMVRVEQAVDEDERVIPGEVVIHFDVLDVLSETIDMEMDHTPLTINKAFPIGTFMDGEPIYLTLREVAALIVGLRGRGKSNLMAVLIHQLSRCVDVCLWGVDLKGGRAIKPWLQPWLREDAVKKPPFDWVATTRAEAWLMINGLIGLIEQRGETGAGGSKITPSPELPAVIMLVDEVAALVGRHSGPKSRRDGQGPTSAEFSSKFTLAIQLGRSEAADLVLCTQRSTVTMTGTGDLKSQCTVRIGMGVNSPHDARSIFEGDSVSAKMVEKFKGKRTRGAIMMQEGDSRVLPGKVFFYGDDDVFLRNVYTAARAHADLTPLLDEAGQDAVERAVRAASGGKLGYHDRWEYTRVRHLYADVPPEVTDEELDSMDDDSDTPREERPPLPTGGPGNRYYVPRRERAQRPVTEPEPEVDTDPQTVDDEAWDAIIAMYEGPDAPEPEPLKAEDADKLTRVVELIDQAGSDGILPGKLLAQLQRAGIAPARGYLYTWLAKVKQDGRVVQPEGKRGRYFTPRHVTS